MKPKEWLLANGHIKEIGRGRLAKDHIALVTAAARTTFIEGYSDEKPEVKVAKPVSHDEHAIVELAPILYPHDEFVAVDLDGGKHSTKAACQQHGYSICGHECPWAIISTARGPVTISRIERK